MKENSQTEIDPAGQNIYFSAKMTKYAYAL